MTLSEFLADLKAKAEAALDALENFNQAHPEVASVEAAALKAGVTDLAGAATATVEKDVPPSADAILDTAIAAAESDADAEIAKITAAKEAKIAALQSAKTTPGVATAGAAAEIIN